MAQKIDESLATIQTRRAGAGSLFLTPMKPADYRILITRSFDTLSDLTSHQLRWSAREDISAEDIGHLLSIHVVDKWWGEDDEGVYSLEDGEPE